VPRSESFNGFDSLSDTIETERVVNRLCAAKTKSGRIGDEVRRGLRVI
jgi:hypothetical protein